MVRKFEKRWSLSHGKEPNSCALAHCRCKIAAENFAEKLCGKAISSSFDISYIGYETWCHQD